LVPDAAAHPLLSLGLWSLGMTLLGTAPTALVTDAAPDGSRSQVKKSLSLRLEADTRATDAGDCAV